MLQNDNILSEIIIEYEKAKSKYPPFHSYHEGYAVIKEELDELWDEIKKEKSTLGPNLKMEKEAIQVSAMAIRFLKDCCKL